MILKNFLSVQGSFLATVLDIQCPRCPPQYTGHMIHLDSLRIYDNGFASLKTRGIKCSYRLRASNYLTITSIRCRSVFRETHAYSSVFSRKSAEKKVHKDVPCPHSGTVLYTMRTVDDKFRKLLTQTADLRLYSYLRIHLNVKIPYVCVCVCVCASM